MGIEYELKFRATKQQQAAIRQAFPGETQTISMETTYYDTPTGQLSARWYTLRRRLENGVSVCTLKAPAGDLGRGEWEVSCNSIEGSLLELCKLSRKPELLVLTAEGLIPVCGARFTRIAQALTLGDTTAELALDEGVLMGGGKEIPLCEVEIELKSGSRETVLAFAKQLQQDYGLVAEHGSKFRRALALYKGE